MLILQGRLFLGENSLPFFVHSEKEKLTTFDNSVRLKWSGIFILDYFVIRWYI